ncbi:hypothetical protein RF11_12506 [Thelohanellus kitauei]|uniref:Uncharacterized protein n=1 Tax=Thelohanellus kitauei TaxID=669202 RepID=A0A0C2J5X9_THEKT|nr:hypothetical protein RF11_12506 [Thelohanellus kitauei]
MKCSIYPDSCYIYQKFLYYPDYKIASCNGEPCSVDCREIKITGLEPHTYYNFVILEYVRGFEYQTNTHAVGVWTKPLSTLISASKIGSHFVIFNIQSSKELKECALRLSRLVPDVNNSGELIPEYLKPATCQGNSCSLECENKIVDNLVPDTYYAFHLFTTISGSQPTTIVLKTEKYDSLIVKAEVDDFDIQFSIISVYPEDTIHIELPDFWSIDQGIEVKHPNNTSHFNFESIVLIEIDIEFCFSKETEGSFHRFSFEMRVNNKIQPGCIIKSNVSSIMVEDIKDQRINCTSKSNSTISTIIIRKLARFKNYRFSFNGPFNYFPRKFRFKHGKIDDF